MKGKLSIFSSYICVITQVVSHWNICHLICNVDNYLNEKITGVKFEHISDNSNLVQLPKIKINNLKE